MSSAQLRESLHPQLAAWFNRTYPAFTEAQLLAVPNILEQRSILLTSPTGSGKTLAGFLGVFDYLLRNVVGTGSDTDRTGAERTFRQNAPPARERNRNTAAGVYCVYVSPLRALTYDITKNLAAPIAGMGLQNELLVHARTGDTPPAQRAKFRRKPAHILVTTPESLAVMLAQESYARHFETCRFVIVDELHSLAENKRGADLTISLERLERICSCRSAADARREARLSKRAPQRRAGICRIGLSATAAPLDVLAQFLVGAGRPCRIAEATTERRSIVEVFSPIRREPYPPAGFTGVRLYAELAELIRSRQSVLVFTNVRSAAEQVGLNLKELLPELADRVEIHHASLDRSVRLEVEDRLKNGELRAVVCSTSLELGIDIGAVDLVVMVATPKGVSRAVQRIGRSGHSLNETSHGVLVATNINDLVEATVTAELVRRRTLDPIRVYPLPVDVVAQHLVGLAALEPIAREEAFELIRRAYPFRELTRPAFDRLLEYLEGGGASLAEQYAGLFGKIRVTDGMIAIATPRVAREFLVNIGTIVSEAHVDVFLRRRRIGSVEEGFIKQLRIGDLFVLGGRVVRLVDTGVQQAHVERADGHLPTIPRWNTAKMPLTSGLARGVRELRSKLAQRLEDSRADCNVRQAAGPSKTKKASRTSIPNGAPSVSRRAADWLVENYTISSANAEAIVQFFRAQLLVSELPVGRRMLVEIYRDHDFSHHFFHSLIGRSANDALSRIVAWRVKARIGGNALVTIDDYGFLLTLRRFQEMPLEDWRLCFEQQGAEEDLHRALRKSELVKWQFRGVAQTGLMVPRNLPGQARRPRQLTWSSEVIFRVLEEHEADHPLLAEAYRQAMHTFLDVEQAVAFLREVQSFDWSLRELAAVSPFSFPIYASVIKETMMLEDPAIAIERIYRELFSRVEDVAATRAASVQ